MVNLFNEGERVLCFHGPLIYEAKCLKFRTNPKTGDNEYWLHYAGWSKKWDEWVPESRVLKYSEANLAHRNELQKSQNSDKKLKTKSSKGGRISLNARDSKASDAQESANDSMDHDSRSSTPILDPKSRIKSEKRRGSPAPSQDEKKSKKERLDHPVETEAQFLNKVEVRIKLPDELKHWLVDDNLMIGKKKKLLILPAKVTVDQILAKWVLSKKTINITAICREVGVGIQEYFNAMLGAQLLYKEERPYYNQNVVNGDTAPSSIYGAVHLLRLFVKMGHTLTYSGLNERTMSLTLSTMQDLLRFMASNVAVYFNMDNYITCE